MTERQPTPLRVSAKLERGALCVFNLSWLQVIVGLILEIGSKEGKQLARVVQDGFLKQVGGADFY